MKNSLRDKIRSSEGLGVYTRLMQYVKPYWLLFVISFIGFLVYAGTQPLFAAMIKHVIDTLQSESKHGVRLLPLLFIALMLVRGIGSFLGNYFLARVSANVVHALRCEIFDHYTVLPTAYYDANNSGYMISRITHNVGEVTRATTDSARTFVREGLTAIGLFGYLVYTNWLLSLIFVAITPIVLVIVNHVSKRLRKLSKRIQDSIGELTHITSELVGGHRIVRSFGGESYEKRRFFENSLYNRHQSLKLAATNSIQGPVMQVILAIALAGLMYLALNVMREASAGEFVAYLSAAFMLPRPFRLLGDANTDVQRGIAAAESLFEVLDQPPEKDSGDFETTRCQGELEFRNLWFSYPGSDRPALRNINIRIPAGKTIALVGASGGGKSTLVNLIPRFYDHEKGEILLDGIDVKEYALGNLRRHIALVTQHITLFNDTIANNIAYGTLAGASRDAVRIAAEGAYAMEFIEKLPDGLDTEIGEHGFKLSGGQRQRLAIARALLKNAPILILDEATSSLDTESERYIQEALKRVMRNRTTLVIAHRLSTIENADLILVMAHGEIVEQGKHADLISLQGVYARLHQSQFRENHENPN
ncbi:MAG: lipid A export permease/ATP-binding protein MsbA [Methylococcaceae bacterium]|nr:lipid A export permease/ATP-binding protein MsbA [Methylococcaceae bacterium]